METKIVVMLQTLKREKYKIEVKKKKEEELQTHVIQISDPLSPLF